MRPEKADSLELTCAASVCSIQGSELQKSPTGLLMFFLFFFVVVYLLGLPTLSIALVIVEYPFNNGHRS